MEENQATAVFKALGDESRLAILRILFEGESYVELLASRLGLTSATVSFHLKKLEAAGLVSCRRTQFYRIYSANREIFSQPLEALIGKTLGKDSEQDKCNYASIHGIDKAKSDLHKLTIEAKNAVSEYDSEGFFTALASELESRKL